MGKKVEYDVKNGLMSLLPFILIFCLVFPSSNSLVQRTAPSTRQRTSFPLQTIASSSPSIVLEQPNNGTIVNETEKIEVTVSNTTDAELDYIEYTWDDGTGETLPSPSSPSQTIYIDAADYFDCDGVDHTVTVYANNTDGASTTKDFTFEIDTIDPTLSLESFGGSDGEAFNPSSTSTIYLQAADANYERTRYRWDDGSYTSDSDTGIDVSTTGLSEGGHDLQVKVEDTAGHQITREYYFIVDSEVPSVSCEVEEGAALRPGTEIKFSIDVTSPAYQDPTEPDGYVRYKWDSADMSANYTEKHENEIFVTVPSTLSYESHELYVEVRDRAGNLLPAEGYTFTIDGAAPEIVLNSPAPHQVVSKGSTVNLTIRDDNVVDTAWYEWHNPDNDLVTEDTFSSPYNVRIPNMKDGEAYIRVFANDTVGHQAQETYYFYIDTSDPTTKLLYPAREHVLVNASTNIVVNITDANLDNITFYWDEDMSLGGSKTVKDTNAQYYFTTEWSPFFNEMEGHNLTIIASDVDDRRISVTYHFIVDDVKPTIKYLSIEENTILSGIERIHIIAADEGNISKVTIRIDDQTTSYVLTTNSKEVDWIVDFDSTNFLSGRGRSFKVLAWDKVLNKRVELTSVIIDNEKPSGWLFTNPEKNEAMNSSEVNVTWEITQNPPSRYANWTIKLDGDNITVLDADTSLSIRNYTVTDLTAGTHTIGITATSYAGFSFTRRRSIAVDLTDPILRFRNSYRGDGKTFTNQDLFTVKWEVENEEDATYRLQKWSSTYDEWRDYTDWTSKTKLEVLLESSGNHTYRVLGKDRAGNIGQTTLPDTLNVIKELVMPHGYLNISTTSPISGDAFLNFNFTLWDNVSSPISGINGKTGNISIVLQSHELLDAGRLTQLERTPNDVYGRWNFQVDLSYVPLESRSSSLMVKMYDKAGNPVYDHIQKRTYLYKELVVDTSGPNVWFNQQKMLQNHSVTTESTIEVSWDGEDEHSGVSHFLLYINKKVWRYTTSKTVYFTLKEGNYTLFIQGVDEAGNVAQTAKLYFLVDRSSPQIHMISNSSFWSSSQLQVQWDGKDKVGIEFYRIYNASGFIKSVTKESTLIPVTERTYNISVVAVDYAGFTASAHWVVTVDYTAPTIELHQPSSEEAYFSQKYISLSWTVNDKHLLTNNTTTTVLLDGKRINVTSRSSLALSLPEGSYTITLKTQDKARNTASKTLSIHIDLTDPTLDVWVKNKKVNGYISENVTELAWEGKDQSPINYTGYVDGVKRFETFQIYWSLNLSDGHHLIRLVATDFAGHSTEKVLTVDVDTDTFVELVSPTSPTMSAKTKRVKISWKTNESISGVQQYRAYLDGELIATPSNTSFYWTFHEGSYEFTLQVRDYAGNQAEDRLTITLDSIPPEVVHTNLHQGDITGKENVTFSWSVKDNISSYSHAKLFVDGSLKRMTSKKEATVKLSNGEHTVELYVFDEAGNYATVQADLKVTGGTLLGIQNKTFMGVLVAMILFYVALGILFLKKKGGED